MVFEVSAAKKEILAKLSERDWTPSDLAEEIGKSRQAVYNHLRDLQKAGVLTTTKVAAKTRPETSYSIGEGFIQYVSVLPGNVTERSLELDRRKRPIVQIWNVPQVEFHPYLEEYWFRLRRERDNLAAVALYGSVARGEANPDSDIDVLLVVKREKEAFEEGYGSSRIEIDDETRIVMAEIYTETEYRESRQEESQFLQNIDNELHPIYDPEALL